MKSIYKAIFSLFLGMALISCAGTDSSAQKKGDIHPSLFRARMPVTDSLTSMAPEFARSVFKGIIDSVPGEYYYHATDGRIDTLFQKEGKQYKAIASITYDSINGQNNYELKKGDCSYFVEDGVLVIELVFPKYYKKYWKNGKISEIATGHLYRDDQNIIKVDRGHSEVYFENGKIKQKNDWKAKQPVASKQWNEKGVLIADLDFPKYSKIYWDNGKPKDIATGIIYRDNQGIIKVDSGHSEIYFENGKNKEKTDWKDKQFVTTKQWNGDGTLITEAVFPNYYKGYWSNGKPKEVLTGLLYRDNQGILWVDSGWSEVYSESGILLGQKKWKDKQIIVCKQWSEDGVLIKDIEFPKSIKEYWNNGKTKIIGTGLLYRDNQGVFKIDSGYSEIYFENGKIYQQNNWKNKQIVVQKEWNENGVLKSKLDFPKYIKEYYENGKIKKELTGLYWTSPTNVEVENGSKKEYFENGRIMAQTNYKEKEPYSSKKWNENGTLTIEWDISAGDLKNYYANGAIQLEIKGFKGFTREKNILIENGYMNLYHNNGKLQVQYQYKEKEIVSKKLWYENGTVMAEGDVSNGFHKVYFQNGKIARDVSGKFHYEDNKIILENGSDKEWYENGNLKSEIVFPKYAKTYSDNGTLVSELKGTLSYNEQGKIQVQDGFIKAYHDNKKIAMHKIFKENRLVSKKGWHPNGNVAISAELPDHYKEFYDNGKIKSEATGTIVEENEGIKIKDGVYNKYDPNGKITISATFKDFQVISVKE